MYIHDMSSLGSSLLVWCLAVALSFGIATSAQAQSCGETGCSGVRITRLYVQEAAILVRTDGPESDVTGCDAQNDYIELELGGPNTDRIYSALLAAKLADRPLSIRTRVRSSQDRQCVIAYIVWDN